MSGRGFSRLCKRLEHWETDPWAVKAVLRKELLTRRVIDPCCGAGVMPEHLRTLDYRVVAQDIHDWGTPDLDYIVDWLGPKAMPPEWVGKEFSVLMNPPFTLAVEFVERAFALGARKVVCFQRYAWYESEGRRAFWDKNPPNRIWICGSRATCWRHDIPKAKRKNGTRKAHAFFVWEQGHPPGPVVGRIYKADAA